MYSVFFVNNIYLFHPCSVIPLYVVYKTYYVYSSANGGIKLLHTYIHKIRQFKTKVDS